MTPENFAAQMQLIHDAGWTTLTTDQLDGWLDGEPLPPHSVMITFDDGATGVWQYADPVLKRLDMHATAFIITGFVGTHAPYYMTWDQITELHNNGRWDIEAHTHLGHVQVPSDNEGNDRAVPEHRGSGCPISTGTRRTRSTALRVNPATWPSASISSSCTACPSRSSSRTRSRPIEMTARLRPTTGLGGVAVPGRPAG